MFQFGFVCMITKGSTGDGSTNCILYTEISPVIVKHTPNNNKMFSCVGASHYFIENYNYGNSFCNDEYATIQTNKLQYTVNVLRISHRFYPAIK